MTVLLGDNWFLETSAAKAREVAQRRLTECDAILGKVRLLVSLLMVMVFGCSWRRSCSGWRAGQGR